MTRMPCPAPALRVALLVLLAAALLSACGFRPRGSVTLPQDFKKIYVDAPVEIADEIANFLDSGGASVIKTRADADAVIEVQSENYDERVMAVDATTGKAREFELLYTLAFSVRMKDGIMLIAPEVLTLRRSYVFDPTAVIGATQNVDALRRDMRRDAAGHIIRTLEVALGE